MKYLLFLMPLGLASYVHADACFTKAGFLGTCTLFGDCFQFQNITEDKSTLAEEHGGCAVRDNATLFCCPETGASDQPVIVAPRDWTSSPEMVLLIFNAVSKGDLEVIEYYLQAGLDPNIAWSNGDTALYHAATHNQLSIVKALLQNKADPNISGSKGTPLHVASGDGNTDLVDVLLAASADVNANGKLFGITPLQVAALNGRFAVIEKLLNAGADVNAANDHGSTALHYAAVGGYVSVLELLIQSGADVNAIDNSGETVLSIAKENGQQCVIAALIKAGVNENTKV